MAVAATCVHAFRVEASATYDQHVGPRARHLATDFNLTEGLIRQHSAPESFQRGQQYYRDGAVRSLVRRGGVIEAEVDGSAPGPYQVRVTFDAGGVTGAACTCPYDRGGWCKHVVAALLMCLHEAQAIEERQPLETRLAGLTAEQLREVLLSIVGRDFQLADALERQLDLLSPGGPEASDATVGIKSHEPWTVGQSGGRFAMSFIASTA